VSVWPATTPTCAQALKKIPEIREEFWENVKVPGSAESLNQSLEMAGRVADFLELGELLALDALHRTESVAVTSAKRAKPKKAKPCAKMTNFRLYHPGNIPASTKHRTSPGTTHL
jgi:succinate dehydrogenase/fumarate reductase flavoprotein subunit